MTTILPMEPTYRVVLEDTRRFRIMVVGVGGTGSTLALFLAGLAYHARQKGIQVELTLVDPDVVEMKNCGRQAVSVQAALAGNVPKVADLALRLNAAYGLDITAWPQAYTAGMGRRWYEYGAVHLIIGCVDNYLGRREMTKSVSGLNGRLWAIDCGNEQNSGQVLVGNLAKPDRIRLDRLGLCSGLPSPYVQEPTLLEPDPDETVHSCAERALAETQSLMVNRMAATIAAQVTAEFVLQRQVTQMQTVFALQPIAVRSQLITRTALRPYLSRS